MIVHRGKNVTYFNMVLNPLSMPSGPVIPSNHIMHVASQTKPPLISMPLLLSKKPYTLPLSVSSHVHSSNIYV